MIRSFKNRIKNGIDEWIKNQVFKYLDQVLSRIKYKRNFNNYRCSTGVIYDLDYYKSQIAENLIEVIDNRVEHVLIKKLNEIELLHKEATNKNKRAKTK